MRGMNKAALIDSAVKIQRTLCAYDMGPKERPDNAPHMCDCKYGCTDVGTMHETGNGCPEMREIVAVLKAITIKELKAIQARHQRKVMAGLRKAKKTKSPF